MQPPDSLWWSQLDGPVVPRAALRQHRDVDIVIVGGGFTGLWCARELKRRDSSLEIVVLEKNVCGFGASGRNGGWASSFYPLSDEAVIARHGEESFDHLRSQLQKGVQALGDAIASDGIDAHFVRGGTLNFARSDVQATRLQEAVSAAHELGATENDIAWLDQDQAHARAALSGQRGATFSPHCARLHPARLVRGLADVNEKLGVSIFENTPVTRTLNATKDHLAEALTPGGSVHARFVVRATEGFTPTIKGERRSVAPLYSLMIATEPQSTEFWEQTGLSHYETFADDRHLIIYGQRTKDNRIAFGGRGAPYHFGSTVEERFDYNAKVFALLEETLHELFPTLQGEITHRWGGPLAMPRNLSPSVVVDYETGRASAGGYTGDGVVLSYIAANALADLIVSPDVETDFTRLPFVQTTLRRWEREPLRWLGINAGLLLAAWADRVETRRHKQSRASGWLDRLFNQFPP